jgi:hypothetical protein
VQQYEIVRVPAGGGQDGMDIGAYVHLYGREFVHTDVRLALEYYLAAARVQGDTPAVRGRLLRELLTESRAYGTDGCRLCCHTGLLFCIAAVWYLGKGGCPGGMTKSGRTTVTPFVCMTGFLLGSGGTDTDSGALAAYVPDRNMRRELISAIAEECAAAAQVCCNF